MTAVAHLHGRPQFGYARYLSRGVQAGGKLPAPAARQMPSSLLVLPVHKGVRNRAVLTDRGGLRRVHVYDIVAA